EFLRHLRREYAEPEKVVRSEREEIRQLADRRKAVLAPQLERNHPVELVQIELDVLREAREVVDAQYRFVAIAADEHEHSAIRRVDRLPRAAAECLVFLAHRDDA